LNGARDYMCIVGPEETEVGAIEMVVSASLAEEGAFNVICL